MSKKKIWLILAACFMAIGALIFVIVMSVYQWDFSRLSTVKYQTNTHEISEDFHDISIETATADVIVKPTQEAGCKVVCVEEEKVKHTVLVQEDTLTVQVVDERAWYEHIGISFGRTSVTVYLPQNAYETLTIKDSTGYVEIAKEFTFSSVDVTANTGKVKCLASTPGVLKIRTSTGDIEVKNGSVGALDLSVSTGRITVEDVACIGDASIGVSTGRTQLKNLTCSNLTSTGDTGDVSLKNVIAVGKFSIERSTGDVYFDGSDAAEIFVETDTGDITGRLLTGKTFNASTDTGRVNVPSSVGGRCELTTDTGDIHITVG